jgi:flagellar basal-body rod modification protein FlgD
MTYVNATSYEWTATQVESSSSSEPSSPKALSGTDFMLLLLTQLQNQNPLEPMSETEMMGQVTSMNSLEELGKISASLEDLNGTNEIGYASSLIGKTVTINLDDEHVVTGEVTSVLRYDGAVKVRVGDVDYPLSDVLLVTNEE